MSSKKGFTLIELLVTISVISILATFGMALLSGVQKNARISKRIEDLKNIHTALEIYKGVKGNYPIVASFSCASSVLATSLEPDYMVKVPEDPLGVDSCYQYISNATDYKLITHSSVRTSGEMTPAQFNTQLSLIDPARDMDPTNGCKLDPAADTGDTGWAYYSSSNTCAWTVTDGAIPVPTPTPAPTSPPPPGPTPSPSPIPSPTPIGGLMAYWKLDDVSGSTTAADSSGNGHTGTVSGGPWRSSGIYGLAYEFDDYNDTVVVPSSLTADLQLKNFTVSLWFRIETMPNDFPTILKKQAPPPNGGTNRNYTISFIKSNGNISVSSTFAGVMKTLNSGNNVNDGQWHHLAYTVTGSTQTLYVDGLQKGTQTNTGTPDTQTSNVEISNVSGGELFNGWVDDVRIYNRALSLTEVNNAKNGSP
jgi:prepilin-type N-terminal cleavage/methylation domain-containing protein